MKLRLTLHVPSNLDPTLMQAIRTRAPENMQEMQEIRRNGNANRSKYRMDSSAAGIDPELLAPRSTTPLNSFFPHFLPTTPQFVTMQSRSEFTSLTPLPRASEHTVLASLQDHRGMITQNPLVVHHAPCPPPPFAPPDEIDAIWFELTDRIDYLPCGLLPGLIHYHASFRDTPHGLQSHVYAPMGVQIRNDWRLRRRGDSQDDHGAGHEGDTSESESGQLCLQETTDLRCPFGTTLFIRRTMRQAHAELVARLATAASLSRDSSPGFRAVGRD